MTDSTAAQPPEERNPKVLTPSPWAGRRVILGVVDVIVLALNFRVAYVAEFARRGTVAAAIGGVLGVVFMMLIVFAVIRAIGKAKTRQSLATVAFWVLLILLIVQLVGFGSRTQPRAAADTVQPGRTAGSWARMSIRQRRRCQMGEGTPLRGKR
jgi:hypothetical protein